MSTSAKLKVNRAAMVVITVAFACGLLGLLTHSRWLGFAGLIAVFVGFIAVGVLRERWIRAEKADPPS